MKFPQVRSMRAVVFALALAVIVPSEVFAQRVLLLASDADAAGAEVVKQRLKDIQVNGIPVFTLVELNRADQETVSLATLLKYDSVMTWSLAPYGDPNQLGDVLSQYVDQGHGVVQAAFSRWDDMGLTLGGRWRDELYDAFSSGGIDGPGAITLVALQPGHAILAGVNGLSGSTNVWQNFVTPRAGELVAAWSNDEPLVNARVLGPQGGRVVGLNFYPIYATDDDGVRLMANALVFATTTERGTNQPPTANAGPDQTLEATGPTGAAFTVTGVVADPDGDTLTIAWTGTGYVGNQPSFSGTLPLGSTTLTLTVGDGNGGTASDTVVITVTDTKGPVLGNLPPALITATATSAAGANVPYGPVTAVDAVDGPLASATCSKSGVFPIGDTVVTCTSKDSRGNESTACFTVRVTDATTFGTMWGDGTIRTGNLRTEVEFAVSERSGSQWAWLKVDVTNVYSHRGDRFKAKTTDFVGFRDDPAVRPGVARVDTVSFSGTGEWNGRSGYRYQMSVVDKGTAGHAALCVRLTITSPTGTVVAQAEGALGSGGNWQDNTSQTSALRVAPTAAATRRR